MPGSWSSRARSGSWTSPRSRLTPRPSRNSCRRCAPMPPPAASRLSPPMFRSTSTPAREFALGRSCRRPPLPPTPSSPAPGHERRRRRSSRRELTLAFRSGGGAGLGVGFFLIVVLLVPLGVGPEPGRLAGARRRHALGRCAPRLPALARPAVPGRSGGWHPRHPRPVAAAARGPGRAQGRGALADHRPAAGGGRPAARAHPAAPGRRPTPGSPPAWPSARPASAFSARSAPPSRSASAAAGSCSRSSCCRSTCLR